MRFEKYRQEVREYGLKLATGNLTVGTWGNISMRIPNEDMMAITPSGVSYEKLKNEDIVLMDFCGNVVEGRLKPSTEYPMHLAIYKNIEEAGAVVHTHSDYVGVFAVARRPIPACSEDMVQIAGGEIRVNEYHLPGTEELGKSVVEALKGRTAAVIASHGGVSIGRDLGEALKTSIVVEKGAKQALFANLIGGPVHLPQEDIDIMRKFYVETYSKK